MLLFHLLHIVVDAIIRITIIIILLLLLLILSLFVLLLCEFSRLVDVLVCIAVIFVFPEVVKDCQKAREGRVRNSSYREFLLYTKQKETERTEIIRCLNGRKYISPN